MSNTKPTNVICIRAAKKRFGKCPHKHIVVDEELAEVQCDDCGEKLNPVATLARFAREQNMHEDLYEKTQQALEYLDRRERTKCTHCGKMTRIRT